MSVLAYYVSGHGFGHAVRSAEVMRALLGRRADLDIYVRTSAPRWLFPEPVRYHVAELDVGVVQEDALRIDASETLARATALARAAPNLVVREAMMLQRVGAKLVVGDIPPLAFLAAAKARVPSVAVANFSWDWIYRAYAAGRAEYDSLIAWIISAYAQAELLLRLPFYGDLSAFRQIEDVPLVSRPASAPRRELRARLGLEDAEQAILLSFGGLGLGGFNSRSLESLTRYTFIATEKEIGPGLRPRNVHLVSAHQDNYSDLVAACDAVVSKPGFGIVANCLALRVPLLYTDRGDFPEYEVLVEAIRRYGRGAFVPQESLRAGDIGRALDELVADTRPWPAIRTDGADVIARRALARLERPG